MHFIGYLSSLVQRICEVIVSYIIPCHAYCTYMYTGSIRHILILGIGLELACN